MCLAAYRQHNPKLPINADCFSTGRMKPGYSMDELAIMRCLSHKFTDYIPL